jgi:hypothetical protein
MLMRMPVASAVRRVAVAVDRRIAESQLALWIAAAGPLLLLYVLTIRVHAQDMSIDSISVTSSSWQLAHHGTPRLPANGSYYDAWIIPSGSGHVVSNREPGLIGLAAVFYRLLPFTANHNVAPASIAAALVTAAAMGTLALVLRRLVRPRVALLAALAAGTATSTWAVSSTALWPHGPDQLYLAMAMLAMAAARFGRAGVAFALAVLTRPPLAIVAAVTGLWGSYVRRSVRPAIVVGTFAACGLAGFLAYSHTFWGGGLQSQYTAAGSASIGDGDFVANFLDVHPSAIVGLLVNVVGTLVSPGRGVFVYSPFLLMLLPGLRAAWAEAPQWARSAAAGGLVYLGVQLKANYFAGGAHFYSYRYAIEPLTLMAPILVLAWQNHVAPTARRRGAFASLLVVAIALQAIGAFCFGNAQRFSNWIPYGVALSFRDHPVAAGSISVAAYVVAAVTYRRVSAGRFSDDSNDNDQVDGRLVEAGS